MGGTVEEAEIVELNVGGKYYAVSRYVIMKYPNSLLAMIISEKRIVDKKGRIFIDADQERFKVVLDFLRYDIIPESKLERKELENFGLWDWKEIKDEGEDIGEWKIEMDEKAEFCGYAFWKQDSEIQSVKGQIGLMKEAAKIYGNSRPATINEYTSLLIDGLPELNESGFAITFTGEEKDIRGKRYSNRGNFYYLKGVSKDQGLDGNIIHDELFCGKRAIICVVDN